MNAHDYALQANGSFALPDACFKVKALMADESSEISDFADVIGIDPSMTSRLLQIANSAIYSFPGEISTISRAITIIGTQAIPALLLACNESLVLLNHNLYLENPDAIVDAVKLELENLS